jgi:hypothetical protein
MAIDLRVKVAVFCRELGGPVLRGILQGCGEEEKLTFQRAEAAFQAGRNDEQLEADLDTLDKTVRQVTGTGLFSPGLRRYRPLPHGSGPETGAQWWTCPRQQCVGRGRVRAGAPVPVCAVNGVPLTAGPLPR